MNKMKENRFEKNRIFAFPKIDPRIFVEEKDGKENRTFYGNRVKMFSSGRSAVYQAAKLLGLGSGNSVLVPAYHCGVEIEALISAGVNVHYYKITPRMEVDKKSVKDSSSNDVKALFVIHYWGFPQDLSWIVAHCQERNIALMEDCAHALYSKHGEKVLGTIGKVGIFSLPKTLGSPNGGILIRNRDCNNVKIEKFKNDWRAFRSGARSILEGFGKRSNSRVSMLADGLLSFKNRFSRNDDLKQFNYGETTLKGYNDGISRLSNYLYNNSDPERIVSRRRKNFLILLEILKSSRGIGISFVNLGEGVCPLFFPIIVQERDLLKSYLAANKIETYIFGRNLHPSLKKEKYLESKFLSDKILGIPIHQDLDESDMERIGETIKLWSSTKC